jgi:hypothetical protein
MSFAENNVVFGSFTTDGTGLQVVNLGFQPSYYHMWNWTQWALTPNPAVPKEAWYVNGMATGSAMYYINTAGAGTNVATRITTGGFSPFTGVEDVLSAPQATAGAITQAGNAQVTLTAHGFLTGDIVRLYGTTGMLQFAGLDFLITRTGANTFTLDGGNSAAFAAPATACTARKVIQGRAFFPGVRTITGITAANPGVVTTSTAHNFVTGQKVRLRVNANFGMTQANNLVVTVTSLTATTFSIGVDTSAFTAFAYPLSAVAAAGVTFPTVTPIGEVSTTLAGAEKNTSYQGLIVGPTLLSVVAGAPAANDVWYYRAERAAS